MLADTIALGAKKKRGKKSSKRRKSSKRTHAARTRAAKPATRRRRKRSTTSKTPAKRSRAKRKKTRASTVSTEAGCVNRGTCARSGKRKARVCAAKVTGLKRYKTKKGTRISLRLSVPE